MTETAAPTALAERRWHWTADTYEKATQDGLFGPDARVELFEGEVVTKLPMLPPHSTVVRLLNTAVIRQLDPERWVVGSQVPIRLSDFSEPEPDLWVARGPQKTYSHRHPGPADLVLVVEVADSSLVEDRRQKIPAYAGAGIPWTWLVSLPDKTLTVYGEPVPVDRRYQQQVVLRPGGTADHAPTGLRVPVVELF